MKRSLQEVIELVVFGLIALLIGTGILWLLGWLLGFVSIVFTFIAGLIWTLLRFIIPIAIVAGVLFFLYRLVTGGKKPTLASATFTTTPVDTSTTSTEPTLTESVIEASDLPVSDRSIGEVSSEAAPYPEENKN
jgi:hypothetical protein